MNCTVSRRKPPRSAAGHNLFKPCPSPARWNGPPSRRNCGEPQCRLRRRLPFAATSGGPTTKLAVALRGRRLERVVTPSDWVHTILAALAHDIGYVRGVCPGDTGEHFVIDAAGNTVTPPRGASDAFLTPYHVERGKIMVRERFASVPFIDEERIAAAIELTRFPVPDDEDHAATDTEAGLVRAGDLIGQLGDPLYPRKLNALYHEFA